MLDLLHIENIAIIEKTDIQFNNGLTVLTGETGAGKSIIIDAITAVMGQRTSRDLIRTGTKNGFVSAVFSNVSDNLKKIISENDLTNNDDDNIVYIQRKISQDGKTSCRINMKPVTASFLKSINPYLINIHGQHDGQKLLDSDCHIDFLDNFAEINNEKQKYFTVYQDLVKTKREINSIEKNEQEMNKRADMLRYQIEEIENVNLTLGEEDSLIEKKAFFDNSGRIAKGLDNAYSYLKGSDDFEGAFSMMDLASNEISILADISEDISDTYNKLEDLKYSVSELSEQINNILSKIDFSETERNIVEERLDLVFKLRRKYGNSSEEILDYLDTIKAEMHDIDFSEERKTKLYERYNKYLDEAKNLAKNISEKRKKASKRLQKAIVLELCDLDMEKVKMNISVQQNHKLTQNGMDTVQFTISTNSGEEFKPLSKIASGGELSRIMLAFKNVLTQNEDVSTLIFDEIDSGVSGRAAQKIAKKLCSISAKKQTLCVTHLPQIAAMGDSHLLITKTDTGSMTTTNVAELSTNARIEELSRMISGDKITENSKNNANELLIQALEYKNLQRGVE